MIITETGSKCFSMTDSSNESRMTQAILGTHALCEASEVEARVDMARLATERRNADGWTAKRSGKDGSSRVDEGERARR